MNGNKIATFQQRLIEVVSEKSLSNSTIAKEIGISKQTLSAWLTGERSPKRPTINAIASYFGVSPIWLMGYDVEKKFSDSIQIAKKPPTPEEQERRDNAQEISRLIMLLPPEHQKMFVAQINAVLAQLKSHPEHQ